MDQLAGKTQQLKLSKANKLSKRKKNKEEKVISTTNKKL